MGKKKKQHKITGELPEAFLERLTQMYGPSVFRALKETFVSRPTTFRINTLRSSKEEILPLLSRNGFKVEKVSWYPDAYILKNKTKRELTDLPLYIEGKIYIQSLASMVPPLLLQPKAGERVLDLTAAPGSKTSQIAAMMGRVGELVANDNNKVRFFKLKHNMEQLGVIPGKTSEPAPEEVEDNSPIDAETTVSDNWTFTLRLEHGAHLCSQYPEYFDKILLDAPCSAEARFVEGEPKSFGYWKERKVKEMAYKQRQLIFAAWNALKPGGTMVYSTCTFAPEENEVQVARLLEREVNAVCEDAKIPGLQTLDPLKEWKGRPFTPGIEKNMRILPTREIEGFYVAVLRKQI